MPLPTCELCGLPVKRTKQRYVTWSFQVQVKRLEEARHHPLHQFMGSRLYTRRMARLICHTKCEGLLRMTLRKFKVVV